MNPATDTRAARHRRCPPALLAAAALAAPALYGQPCRADTLSPAAGAAAAHDTASFHGLARARGSEAGQRVTPCAAPVPLAPTRSPAPAAAAPAEAGVSLASSDPSSAPAASFEALDDNGTVIPPDTNGAAGPNQLMVALNSEIRLQYRTGVQIARMPLDSFWAGLNGTNPDPYDPKTVYDPYGARFIFTCAANAFSADSALLIAVSRTADATGEWNRYLIDTDAQNTHFADFPSVGFTRDWIIVQVNMFPIGSGAMYSNIYVFSKSDLYTGGTGQYRVFRDDTGFTQVPAIAYDETLDKAYLLEEFSESASGQLRLSSISGPVGEEVFNRGIAFPTASSGWDFRAASGLDSAPQADSEHTVATNDARILSLVYRAGSLWAAHTVFLPQGEGLRSSVQWWQLGTDGGVLQRGLVDDPAGATFYAFPSLSVNRNRDVLIGYSRFSAGRYASANYAFRAATDAPGTLRADTVLKEGEAPYYKTYDGFSNRWGDYSMTMVDPVNDVDFWTIQQYAESPLGGTDRWGTWWGKIPGIQPVPVNDTCLQAEQIELLPYISTTNTRSATSVGDPAAPCVPSFGRGVWYSYHADEDGVVTADTVGSEFDTGLLVFSGDCSELTQVACDDDSGGGTGASRVIVPVEADTTYWFVAGGYHGEGGHLRFRIQPATPSILDFFPEAGAVGSSVSINGSSFFGATSVEFNGVPDPTAVVDSASHISAKVPEGATTGPITVTTPGGTAVSQTDFAVIPSVYIDDTSAVEGNSGTSSASFAVHLSARSLATVSVAYTTVNGTAKSGEDYRTSTGVVTFPPNTDTASIPVTIVGDTVQEQNEYFFVNLSNPVGAVITRAQGRCTIIDNDSDQPVIVADGFTLTEESCTPGNQAIDPDERVTVTLKLKNIGPTATENLVAALMQSSSVAEPGLAQTYGALAANGGSATMPFTFTARGSCGSSFTAVLKLTDGEQDMGSATFGFILGPVGMASTFTSLEPITIPSSGKASAYPSVIEVSGMSGTISRVTVTLNSVSHTYPDDLDVLLVGPLGQAVVLMSDCGGSPDLAGTNINFDDSASGPLPDASLIASGTYLPSNYPPADSFPSPAPLQPYGGAMSAFAGGDPNGAWSLYVLDDATGSSGSIAGGWSLSITTGTQLCCRLADLSLAKTDSPDPVTNGSKLTYTLLVTNNGPSQATHVMVTDTLPADTELVTVSPSQGQANHVSGTVTADLGTIQAGAQASVTVVVKPTRRVPITNTASVTSSDPDPDLSNNSSSASTDVGDPALMVDDVMLKEGNEGTTLAEFTIALSAPTEQIVRADYSTEPLTASAGEDYAPQSGTVTLGNEITQVKVSVPVVGDTNEEGNETFALRISNAVNASIIDDGMGVCTIRDDDTRPVIDMVEVSPAMGAAGDSLQVLAHATDDWGMAGVTADLAALASAGGGYWTGLIQASAELGEHAVSVVATDVDGNTATSTDGTYRSVRSVVLRASSASDSIIEGAATEFLFTVAGRVTVLDAGSFLLDDGSARKVTVVAIGHGLQNGDLAKARGTLNRTTNPPTLTSSLDRIEKLD